MHNVSLLRSDNDRTWLGKLVTEEDYLGIVDWAIGVAEKGNSASLPEHLEQHRFLPD